MKFKSTYKKIDSRKCIWTYRLYNGGHFVQGDKYVVNLHDLHDVIHSCFRSTLVYLAFILLRWYGGEV